MSNNENEIEKLLDENLELIQEFFCPSDMTLIYFVTENLDESEHNKIEKHINECDDCKRIVDDLKKASKWFDSKREQMLHNLEQKAISEGLLSWYGFHLPDYLILAYLHGKIPDNKMGDNIRKDIETHLEQCNTCMKKFQGYKTDDRT